MATLSSKVSKAQTRKLLRLCQAGSCDAPPATPPPPLPGPAPASFSSTGGGGGGTDPGRAALERALGGLGGSEGGLGLGLAVARDVRGPGRETLLHRACAHGASLPLVSYLLDVVRCDPDARNDQMKTPLHEACTSGHARIVALLLASGALVDAHRTHSWTPLMYASSRDHVDVAALLLEHGSPVKARNQDGMTALYLAAREGAARCARLMLDRSGTGNNDSDNGSGSGSSSSSSNNEKALINMASNTQRTPLHVAIKYDRRAIVDMLFGEAALDCGLVDSRKWGMWHEAAAVDACGVIETHLARGAPHATSRDARGRTPVAVAALHGSLGVMAILLRCDGDGDGNAQFRELVDVPDDNGNTPLALAASKGHADMCKMLIETGRVDVDRPCAKGKRFALHLAAGFGHVGAVRVLLAAGANRGVRDVPAGRTPFELAEVMGHAAVVEMF
jgi:ankyrin repeat protein